MFKLSSLFKYLSQFTLFKDSVRSFGSVESGNQWIPGGVTTYSMDVIPEQEPEPPALPPVPPCPPPVDVGSSEEDSYEDDEDMPPPGSAPPPGRPPLPSEINKKPSRPPSMSTTYKTGGSASMDSR